MAATGQLVYEIVKWRGDNDLENDREATEGIHI